MPYGSGGWGTGGVGTGGDTATGGASTGTGGDVGIGGARMGGSTGTGPMPATGGVPVGGSVATGGRGSTGGGAGTITGAGGVTGTGGAGTGGLTRAGGGAGTMTGAGGVTGTGGAGTGGVTRAGGAGGAATGTGGTGGAGTGRALRFDGVDDSVTLPAGPGAANETAFGSELWFKTTTLTGVLFEVYGPNGADRSSYLKEGKVCFYVWTPSYSELCTAADTFADGWWHHVAGTLGDGGQRLYVDGVLQASASAVRSSAFSDDQQLQLGYGPIGPGGPLFHFAGVLDEVRLWSVERSAWEIADNRNGPIDPATPGLQGYWRLDESGAAATATDATGAGHDGGLNGFSFAPSPWVTGAF
jgi:hypothetical protein